MKANTGSVKLCNVLFPIWILIFFPQVLAIVIPGNLIVDAAVAAHRPGGNAPQGKGGGPPQVLVEGVAAGLRRRPDRRGLDGAGMVP